MGVHQSGGHGGAVQIDDFRGLSSAPSGHHAIGNGQVGGDPFPGGRRQHPAPTQQEIGRLIAAGNRQDVG